MICVAVSRSRLKYSCRTITTNSIGVKSSFKSTTWNRGGGSVLAVLRSTTTAPCPSSGFGLGGCSGNFGFSSGMESFYRVDIPMGIVWDIEPSGQSASAEMHHDGRIFHALRGRPRVHHLAGQLS